MEGELDKRSWRDAAYTIAFEAVAAVPRGAREMIIRISALGAAPDAAGPVGGGGVEGAVGEAGYWIALERIKRVKRRERERAVEEEAAMAGGGREEWRKC